MSSESSLLAVVNSVGSLLGPWPARKIIDGEVSSDACAILDAYSTYGHPAVSLLAAVVAGHRRGTPSGATSCIVMCGILACEIVRLQHATREPCTAISRAMMHASQMCVATLRDMAVPILAMPGTGVQAPSALREDQDDDVAWFFEESSSEEEDNQKDTTQDAPGSEVRVVGAGLCHGASFAMALACQAVEMLGIEALDISRVLVERELHRSSSCSCVQQGVPLCAPQPQRPSGALAAQWQRGDTPCMPAQWQRGDTPWSRHGYLVLFDPQDDAPLGLPSGLCSALHSREVAVLGSTAALSDDIKEELALHGMLAVDGLSSAQALALARHCSARSCTGWEDMLTGALSDPQDFAWWDTSDHQAGNEVNRGCKYRQASSEAPNLFVRSCEPGYGAVTALLCARTTLELNDLSMSFHKCLHRLCAAIKERCLVPGGGLAELRCIVTLLGHPVNTADPLQQRCNEGFAGALETYLLLLLRNMGVEQVAALELLKSTLACWVHQGEELASLHWQESIQEYSQDSQLSVHTFDCLSAKVGAIMSASQFAQTLLASDMA